MDLREHHFVLEHQKVRVEEGGLMGTQGFGDLPLDLEEVATRPGDRFLQSRQFA
jgi:hypothetical protein